MYKPNSIENRINNLKLEISKLQSLYGSDSLKLMELLESLADSYSDNGAFEEEESIRKRVVKMCVKKLPSPHSATGVAKAKLADVYYILNKHLEADSLYSQAVDIFERTLPVTSEYIVATLINRAANCVELENYAKAEELYLQAINVIPQSNPYLFNCLISICKLNCIQSRYYEAEQICVKAVELLEETLPVNYPEIIRTLIFLSDIYTNLSRFEDADIQRDLAVKYCNIAINESISDEDLSNIIDLLMVTADLYSEAGKYVYEEQLRKQILSLRNQKFPSDHAKIGSDLHDLAIVYRKLGKYNEAADIHQQSLDEMKQVYLSNDPIIAPALGGLGNVNFELGNYKKAEEYYKQEIEILKDKRSPNDPEMATCWCKLANLNTIFGNFDEANKLYKLSVQILDNNDSYDISQKAIAINNLAASYINCRNYNDASLLYDKYVTVFKKLSDNHSQVAISIIHKACISSGLGDYIEAEKLNNLALNTFNNTISDATGISHTLFLHIADIYSKLGYFDKAEANYMNALDSISKLLPTEHKDVASILSSLGELYTKACRFTDAETAYKQANDILIKQLPFSEVSIRANIGKLANLYTDMGRFTEAINLHEQILYISESISTDNLLIADNLNILANCLSKSGRYHEAESHFKRSLEIKKRDISYSNHPEIAKGLFNLAQCNEAQGNFTEAKSLLEEALSMLKMWLPQTHPDILWCSYKLALLYDRNEMHSDAIIILKDIVNNLRDIRGFVSLKDEETLQPIDSIIENVYKSLTGLLIRESRFAEAAQVLDFYKESECFEFVRRDSTLDFIVLADTYNSPEEIQQKRENETLSSITNRHRELQAQKYRSSEEEVELTNLEEKILTAKMDFLKFEDMKYEQWGEDSAKRIFNEVQLYQPEQGCFLIRHIVSGSLETITVNPSCIYQGYSNASITKDILNQKIEQYIKMIADISTDMNSIITLAQELYNIVLAPWINEIEESGTKTILWQLEGVLRLLPVCALHDGEQFLIEKYQNVALTAMSMKNLQNEPHANWHALGMGITKGNPDEGFDPLPYVFDEVGGIIRPTGILDGTIKLDDAFTWKNMKDELNPDGNPYRAVHVATHFKLDSYNETSCGLYFGDGELLSLDKMKVESNLFRDVDIVTFSACSTGVGTRRAKGREVDGIGFVAEWLGAQSVLATLWPVYDPSTALLMKEFYRLRNEEGVTKGEALRLSQFKMLKGTLRDGLGVPYPHPYYWAPYFLIGNYK